MDNNKQTLIRSLLNEIIVYERLIECRATKGKEIADDITHRDNAVKRLNEELGFTAITLINGGKK